ncbi:MAG: PRC-barrel domain-containing protein [Methanobacterium sp.]|nr:PRC-barrel domain-containing protein [Methanobacterium sp.]
MKTSELMGKKVIDKNAFEIGKVNDIELDTEEWQVTGIFISSGILGSDTRVPVEDVAKVGDFVILKVEMKTVK